ncbi:MAG: hypothetical protein ACOCWL_01265 [Thermoguttaceae bacterium]
MPGSPRYRFVAAMLLSQAALAIPAPGGAREVPKLQVLGGGYPRAFFFRASEGHARQGRVDFDAWEACFARLMGIEGKVLAEEIPDMPDRNAEFFTRLKQKHPEQLVLLHYNGNARDPRDAGSGFFAGHWLYYNGAVLLDDVPAESGETDLRVSDTRLFLTQVGRYRDRNEDIGLCMLDTDGKPDWTRSEQVELVSVDHRAGTIRVRRGCHGTEALAWPGGAGYAAAHVTEGPWGRRSNLMWFYNYATDSPRDAQGRQCLDVLADEVAARFAPGGELAAFDGVQFDVLHNTPGRRSPGRAPDGNADGRADHGVSDGVNRYGAGVVEFCRKLREKMGPNKLILADGHGERHQRAFRLLNGIESEGWPALNDWALRDFSGGMNRHFFWAQAGAPPVLNYINHKYIEPLAEPGTHRVPDVSYRTSRLVFAAAVMTDAAVCYSFAPPAEEGELLGIWDELHKGTEQEVGWLGQPLGPAVRMARQTADVLDGTADPPSRELLSRLERSPAALSLDGRAVKIAPPGPHADALELVLDAVPCRGPDLTVLVTARAAPRARHPAEMARLMHVGTAPPRGQLVLPELPPFGVCYRGGKEEQLDEEDASEQVTFRRVDAMELGGAAHPAYLAHPPYKDSKGYTFWFRDVDVPEQGVVECFTGMGEKSPGRSDGVVFRMEIAPLGAGRAGTYETLLEHTQVAAQWVPHEVRLDRWQGRRVRLKFVTDCGPRDNSTTDHAYWGDVAVLGPTRRTNWTEPTRFMTWVDPETFTSAFYFGDVRSPAIDLRMTIEGTEPAWIESITVHRAPDTLYRRFENGLVLLNPALHPVTFDLEAIAPGESFRRLRGSSRQDPTTNNGRPVGRYVTLGPKDGLFLVRRPE